MCKGWGGGVRGDSSLSFGLRLRVRTAVRDVITVEDEERKTVTPGICKGAGKSEVSRGGRVTLHRKLDEKSRIWGQESAASLKWTGVSPDADARSSLGAAVCCSRP
ncbi:hypothetical protein CB1_000505006 [Camelus ferus]|nr:hypothetical protein CB1_000505006 [Camelus ferus]